MDESGKPMAKPAPDPLLGTLADLSDPVRIRLLRLLSGRELGVADLCEALQAPQSTVSRHLKILADAGWVGSRRAGTSRLYAMEATSGVRAGLWTAIHEASAAWREATQDQRRLEAALRRRQGERFIAGSAAEWQAMRAEAYGRLFPFEAALGLLPRHWVVADLGCAAGLLVSDLARHVKKVVGVDNDPDMLQAARELNAAHANAEIRAGDLAKLPIKDGQVDAALLVLVLAWVEDPAAALAEAARILRPGGRLVVVDIQRHDRADFFRAMRQRHMGFDDKTLAGWLKKAGLSDIRIQPLPHDPEARGPGLFVACGSK